MIFLKSGLISALILMSLPGIAGAAEHVVRAVGVAFKPMVVLAQPGDTIKWVNMAAHNTESIEGMLPEGAASWKSELSAGFAVTLDKEGVYIYKCAPHIGLGMGGAIIIGNPVNFDAVKLAAPKNPLKRIVKKAGKKAKKAGLVFGKVATASEKKEVVLVPDREQDKSTVSPCPKTSAP